MALAISDALRSVGNNATEIDIMVTPNAKINSIGSVDPWRKRIVVRVQSLPLEGKANSTVTAIFEKLFGTKVEIIRGHTDRHKTLFVNLNIEDVLKALMKNEKST